MRKILFVFIFSTLLISFAVNFENVSSQTQNQSQKEISGEEERWLRNDIKVADVVAYVDVKEIKLIDSLGEDADCENNTGSGYCLYLLTADAKEMFKGDADKKRIEFYVNPDASYPKKNLTGEKVVFLVWSGDEKNEKKSLNTIENSTRLTNVIKTIRKIKSQQMPIDETDEFNPYSLASLKKDFKSADMVLYANVESFSSGEDGLSPQEFVLEASIKDVFKGNFKSGQKIEYRDDLLYRPFRKEDLGERILFLEKNEDEGKIYFSRINYTADDVEYNVLEKLRKITDEK